MERLTIGILVLVLCIVGFAMWLIFLPPGRYSSLEYGCPAYGGICVSSSECASLVEVDVACDDSGLVCCAEPRVDARER